MQRALDSAIGLPSRSTRASLMLAFLIPADVRRSFMLPPGVRTAGGPARAYGSVGVGTDRRPKTHRLRQKRRHRQRIKGTRTRRLVCALATRSRPVATRDAPFDRLRA